MSIGNVSLIVNGDPSTIAVFDIWFKKTEFAEIV
jgi:hypothetical protein